MEADPGGRGLGGSRGGVPVVRAVLKTPFLWVFAGLRSAFFVLSSVRWFLRVCRFSTDELKLVAAVQQQRAALAERPRQM